MDDDPEEIYEAPPIQEEVTKNFKQLIKAFESKPHGVMQMAKDGRFQAPDNKGAKPKPPVKPKPVTKMGYVGGPDAPMLPMKKRQQQQQQPQQQPQNKPQYPQPVGLLPPKTALSNGISSRISMFPPSDDNDDSVQNTDKKKENPINGLQKILSSRKVRFSSDEPYRDLPPPKPESLADISLDEFLNEQFVEDYDPEEIYDDIAPPPDSDMEENPLPLPAKQRPFSTVSLIPEMTEEDELEAKGVTGVATVPTSVSPEDDDTQDIYDDVAHEDNDTQEEIYEAVDEL